MNDVEFERLLSHRGDGGDLCVRDALFDYFCRKFPHSLDVANAETKKFTDELYKKFVNRGA